VEIFLDLERVSKSRGFIQKLTRGVQFTGRETKLRPSPRPEGWREREVGFLGRRQQAPSPPVKTSGIRGGTPKNRKTEKQKNFLRIEKPNVKNQM